MSKITGDQIAVGTITQANLVNSGVTPGVYGGATTSVQFAVTTDGRITSAVAVSIVTTDIPGGSDKNVQYNSGGAFAGVSNNTTAISKYLRQVSTGTPSWVQVTDSEISFSDVTTNNATTSAHGYLPKLDGVTTHFLAGDGAWMTIPNANVTASSLTTNALVVASGILGIQSGNLTGDVVTTDNTTAFIPSGTITESKISLSDVTTNNATTSAHGYLSKLSGLTTQYMDGSGVWSVPAGGGGGGNVTSQGTAGSEPGSPSSGDLYFETNGFMVERYSGSAWVPYGPVYPMTKPSVSAPTTWVNQGSATIDTSTGAYILSEGGSAVSWRIRDKASPSTPYTITAAFLITGEVNSSYPACGIGWRESSSGKIAGIYYNGNAGNGHQWVSTTWTDVSTFSSNYASVSPFPMCPGVLWARIADNGTNRMTYYSGDGVTWHIVNTVTRTDFLTPDRVFFGIVPRADGKTLAMTLLSWKEE